MSNSRVAVAHIKKINNKNKFQDKFDEKICANSSGNGLPIKTPALNQILTYCPPFFFLF